MPPTSAPRVALPLASALRDAAALRAIETLASARLGDPFELMRRAGQAAWRDLLGAWPHAQRIVVVCGPGNNGGDGYVMARHARLAGRQVSVVRAAPPRGEPAQRAGLEYTQAGGAVIEFAGTLPVADVVVDAVFGIGLSRAPDEANAAMIEAITAQSAPVLSLDVPSGLDADSGHAP